MAANGCGGRVRHRRLDLRSARRGRGHERPGRGSTGLGLGRSVVRGAGHLRTGRGVRPGCRALPWPVPAREPGRGQGGGTGGRAGRVLPDAGRPDADLQSAHRTADRPGQRGAGPGGDARRPVRGLRGAATVPAARPDGREDHRLRGRGRRRPADPPADHPVRRGLPAGGDPRRRPRQAAPADPRRPGARRPRPDGGGRRQHRGQGRGHRHRRGRPARSSRISPRRPSAAGSSRR